MQGSQPFIGTFKWEVPMIVCIWGVWNHLKWKTKGVLFTLKWEWNSLTNCAVERIWLFCCSMWKLKISAWDVRVHYNFSTKLFGLFLVSSTRIRGHQLQHTEWPCQTCSHDSRTSACCPSVIYSNLPIKSNHTDALSFMLIFWVQSTSDKHLDSLLS